MKKNYFGCRFLNRAVFSILTTVFLALVSCGCSEPKAKGETADSSIVLMTWNVHNLFDGKDNGNEYDEYRESSGWSVEKYLGRINTISAAIETVEPQPDIIMFQEIESLNILEDMEKTLSKKYSWSHFANNPGAALGLGILSRFPLLETRVHSVTIGSETTPRPVLETRIHSDEGDFVIFVCHWKSKLGGDDATENVRMASSRVINRRIRELWDGEPELGIIVAGDLNENHDEFYRRGAKEVCALLPDDPFSAQLTGCSGKDGKEAAGLQKDFIVISKNKPPLPVHFPRDSVVLYSPWISELENGSYFYKYAWETIDHFLISGQFFGGKNWEYERVRVLDDPHFANSGGIPVPYNRKTGSGLSDHLPLMLVLKMKYNEEGG